MKTAKYWIRPVATDAALAFMFWYWATSGSVGAGNALAFMVWTFAVLKLLIGLSLDKTDFENKPRLTGFSVYANITDLALIFALAWVGWFWAAGFYLVGAIAYGTAREREPKAKGDAA